MEEIKRSHRHFLAVPLLLVLVVVSMSNRSSIKATVMPSSFSNSTDSPVVESMGDGIYAMLFPDTEVDNSSVVLGLVKGSMLIQGEGISVIIVNAFKLTSFEGAFYVMLKNDRVTVAAISAPVFVEEGAKAVLVPVGYQWRSGDALNRIDAGYKLWAEGRNLTRLPTSFRHAQLTNLTLFSEDEVESSFVWNAIREKIISMMGTFQLEKAHERSEKMRESTVLHNVQQLIEDGEQEKARKVLMDPEHEELFTSLRGQQTLARVAGNASEDTPLYAALLEPLFEDEGLWLLASIHPDARKTAWGMHKPNARREVVSLYLLTLPQSDILPDPLPSFVVEGWKNEVLRYVSSLEEPEEFLEVLVTRLIDLTRSFARLDFPNRARGYRAILSHIVNLHGRYVSDALQSEISELEKSEEVGIDWNLKTFEVEAVDEIPEELPTGELTPGEVKARAYELMRDAGALFTVETTIEEKSPREAHVQGIVFSSAKGDHLLDFTLNVVTGHVSQVLWEGKILPYSMGLVEFVEWVRK